MAWPTAEQQHFRVIRMNQIHRAHPQRRRNRLKHPQADRIPLRHAVQQRAVIYLSRIRQGTFRKPILLTGDFIQRPSSRPCFQTARRAAGAAAGVQHFNRHVTAEHPHCAVPTCQNAPVLSSGTADACTNHEDGGGVRVFRRTAAHFAQQRSSSIVHQENGRAECLL